MNIIQKNKIKKQILDNIERARRVYENMKKCLVPANNIYWCYNLQLPATCDDDQNLSRLQKNIPMLFTYIEEFRDIYQANIKLCQDCPKMEEFSEDFFKKSLIRFKIDISTRINEIENLPFYSTTKDLQKTAKLLKTALASLNSKTQYMFENSQVLA